MAGDPAFLFYSSDFLTGVSDLTFEERGQYITLLCMQHQKGHLSGKAVAIAVPNATADVLAKFSLDDDGKYYNTRLELEATKRAEYAAKQKQRAIDGWKKRKEKQQNIKENGNATALPIEDENVNEDRDKKEIKIESIIFPFNTDEFKNQWEYWKNYKSKEFKFKYKSIQSEQAALKQLANLSKNNEEIAIEIIHQSFANGWKGFFELKNQSNNKFTDDGNQLNRLLCELDSERNSK